MQSLQLENLHDGRAQLRVVMAVIDQELLLLSGHLMRDDPHTTSERLVASWSKLVDLLALGPAPETRTCPTCSRIGMRQAIRCGYCWTKLAPWVASPAPTK